MIITIICMILVFVVGRRLLHFSLSAPRDKKPVYDAALLSRKMVKTYYDNVLYLDGIDKRLRKMKRIAVDMEDDLSNLVVIGQIKQMNLSNMQMYAICYNRSMSRLYLQEGVILLKDEQEIDEVISHAGKE